MATTGIQVGMTRSGKPIYAPLLTQKPGIHPACQDFDLDDHYCAFAVFAYLTLRVERTLGKNASEYFFYYTCACEHFETPGLANVFETLRQCAGNISAFDDLKLGRALCSIEFRD